METRYYKYISKRTGKLTKNYGFTATVPWVKSLHIVMEGSTAVVKDSSLSTRTHSWTPAGEGVEELSQVDFENLSLPDESIFDKINREKVEILIARLIVKENTPFPPDFITNIKNKFEQLHQ